MSRQTLSPTLGSSPLTRGKLNLETVTDEAVGLIPAHAGKTNGPASSPGRGRAHPRSRGENDVRGTHRSNSRGSSPLTRGKPVGHEASCECVRLIPAHAGKTRTSLRASRLRAAHPRSRGENDKRYIPLIHERGSSPLTRGKPTLIATVATPTRLIPAHAGKTAQVGMEPPGGAGSSPLTRGKLYRGGQHVRRHRLIPAHAGKTSRG